MATHQELTAAAEQWRAYGATCALPAQRDIAERTARNLEKQAETGVATCLCCNKPFGEGLRIFSTKAPR